MTPPSYAALAATSCTVVIIVVILCVMYVQCLLVLIDVVNMKYVISYSVVVNVAATTRQYRANPNNVMIAHLYLFVNQVVK